MKWPSWVNAVLGLWLLMSPAILQYASGTAQSEDVLLGIGVFVVAIWSIAAAMSTTVPAWINVILGVWIVLAPWILGYSYDGVATTNDLIVGALVVICAFVRIGSRPRLPLGPGSNRV